MKIRIMAMIITALMPSVVFADINVNFKGNLILPDCTVNNNNPVEIDFGDIEIQMLTAKDTAYHGQDFDIPLTCPYIQGTPMLTLSAVVHDAAKGIIQTSKYNEGLVIYIMQKGGLTAVPLNTATNVTNSVTGSGNTKTLTLNAGIGRYKDIPSLTPGPFTANASLQVRYE